jgi:hypothetical protein
VQDDSFDWYLSSLLLIHIEDRIQDDRGKITAAENFLLQLCDVVGGEFLDRLGRPRLTGSGCGVTWMTAEDRKLFGTLKLAPAATIAPAAAMTASFHASVPFVICILMAPRKTFENTGSFPVRDSTRASESVSGIE